MKVLIIEDDPIIVETVKLCFEIKWTDTDVECQYAHQGGEGLEQVEAYSPDIVLLDLGLPDIDGLALLQQIRGFSKVPVIILTARDREIDKVTGLDLGADDYIVKPFSHAELLSRVRAVLRRSQMPELEASESRLNASKVLVKYTTDNEDIAGQYINLTADSHDGNNGNNGKNGENHLVEVSVPDSYCMTEAEETKVEEETDVGWKEYNIEFTWEQFSREFKSAYIFCHSNLSKLKLLVPGTSSNIYTRFIKTIRNGVR